METVQLKGLKYDSALQSINSGYYIVLSSIIKSKVSRTLVSFVAVIEVEHMKIVILDSLFLSNDVLCYFYTAFNSTLTIIC